MKSVFVAHSSKDKPFARRLAQDLNAYGVRVWLDEAELLIGDSLINRIQSAIAEMDYVAAILSKHSIRSKWVQKELEAALSLELAGEAVKVLPILIDDCTLPPFLQGKVYADFRSESDYPFEFRRLLTRLAPLKPQPRSRRRKRAPHERIASLELANEIVTGRSPHGLDLTDASILLFAILDGSADYFGEYQSRAFGVFFARFAEVHRPSIALLLSIAEFEWNKDWVIAGAVFGLSQMRSSEGRNAFRAALASPAIDVYDKYRAIVDVLKYSLLSSRDLPVDFWDLIHTGISYRLTKHDFNYLKQVEPSAQKYSPGIDAEWLKVLARSRYLTGGGYRSNAPSQRELKLSRINAAWEALTAGADPRLSGR